MCVTWRLPHPLSPSMMILSSALRLDDIDSPPPLTNTILRLLLSFSPLCYVGAPDDRVSLFLPDRNINNQDTRLAGGVHRYYL